jgi:hypothetical protein
MLRNLQRIRSWQRLNVNVAQTGPPISDQRTKKNGLGKNFFSKVEILMKFKIEI